jgi:hypothetical protein
MLARYCALDVLACAQIFVAMYPQLCDWFALAFALLVGDYAAGCHMNALGMA